VFSHVMILKAGTVLVAGKKTTVVNSSNLSHAFDAGMRLCRAGNRYALVVKAKLRGML